MRAEEEILKVMTAVASGSTSLPAATTIQNLGDSGDDDPPPTGSGEGGGTPPPGPNSGEGGGTPPPGGDSGTGGAEPPSTS